MLGAIHMVALHYGISILNQAWLWPGPSLSCCRCYLVVHASMAHAASPTHPSHATIHLILSDMYDAKARAYVTTCVAIGQVFATQAFTIAYIPHGASSPSGCRHSHWQYARGSPGSNYRMAGEQIDASVSARHNLLRVIEAIHCPPLVNPNLACQAPFAIVSAPALLVAVVVLLFVNEPARGAQELAALQKVEARRSLRVVLVVCNKSSIGRAPCIVPKIAPSERCHPRTFTRALARKQTSHTRKRSTVKSEIYQLSGAFEF